jgi:tetratricopeptide (TPR) repeat protein
MLHELQRVYINIGYVHQSLTSEYPKALRAYGESRQILERLTRDHPAVTEFQLTKAGVYDDISEILLATERFGEARELLGQALEILERLIATDPTNSRARQFCAGCYMNSGFAEQRLKRFAEALALSHRAQAMFEELLRGDPDQLEKLEDLIVCLQLAAEVHEASGQSMEAQSDYQRAINLVESTQEKSLQQFRPLLHTLVECYTALGNCQRTAGQLARVEHSYQQVLSIRLRYFRDDKTCSTLRLFYPAWIALGQLKSTAASRTRGGGRCYRQRK